MTNEKIVCPCFVTVSGTVVLCPTNVLPMDTYNYHMKHNPTFHLVTSPVINFVTNYGFVVTEEQAAKIALHSGQVDELKTKGKLSYEDLFTRGENK